MTDLRDEARLIDEALRGCEAMLARLRAEIADRDRRMQPCYRDLREVEVRARFAAPCETRSMIRAAF